MNSNVLHFPGSAFAGDRRTTRPQTTLTRRELRRAGRPDLPPPATETARNARIRDKLGIQ